MVFEYRRRTLRLLYRRERDIGLLLDLLDTAFDVADCLFVLIERYPIGGPEFPYQIGQLSGHRVENTLRLAQPEVPRRAIRAAASAKKLFENRARVRFHGQRLRGTTPRKCMGINAAQIAC